LVFVVAATWWTFHLGRRDASNSVRDEAIRDLTWTASRLESTFERAIRLGDDETVQEEVAALGANREFTLAVLTDENSAVLHSMRLADVGKQLEQVLPDAFEGAALLKPERLSVIRQRKGGSVASTGDGHTLIAAYPLVLGTRPGELRPNRIGSLVLVSDYSSRQAAALQLVTRQAIGFVTMTSLFAVVLGLFFHVAIARRLKRLARVAEHFGAGGTHVQSGIGGSDEVAQLARSFDKMMVEQVAAGVQLKESEERYRGLLESTYDMVQSVSPEGRFLFVNPKWENTLGYNDDDLKQMTTLDIIHPDSLEHCQLLFQTVMSGESVPQLEATFIAKDGRSVVVEGNVSPRLSDGRIVASHGFFRDITQRKQAEYELRLQGQALNTGATAVTFADLNGDITYVNKAFVRMWGYVQQDELIGRPLTEMSSSAEDADEVIMGLREHGEWIGERLGKKKDGSLFEMQISASMVLGGDGEPISMMASFVDISDLKRVERSLTRLNEQLEERIEERTQQLRETQDQLVRKEKLATLGQLAGTVAHEIRNPLGIIKNAVYYLESTSSADNKEASESFGEINRALTSSNRIVGELLDFAHDPKLDVTEFATNDVVDRALSVVTVPEDIDIQCECNDSDVRFRADAGQVERILINLIQNAVQAMPDGGSLTIRCRRVAGQQTQIEVEDTGHGIRQDELEKVFEPLYSRRVKGVGLGLALCRRYAELNHGTLIANSELKQGSTFCLTLPCAVEQPGN
jgi:PAS domain S-box-containing protein